MDKLKKMTAIKVGSKCILTTGRRSGEEVEILEIIDKNFVKVKNKKGKERRCNVMHLEPI